MARFVDRYCTNTSFMLYRYNLSRLDSPVPDANNIAFLGDSSLRSSLDPLVFQAATDNRALNLGLVMASGVMSDYYMAERYLGTQSAPNAIVLVHTPRALQSGFSKALYTTHFPSFTENHKLYFEGIFSFLETIDAHLRTVFASYRLSPYAKRVLQPVVDWNLSKMDADQRVRESFVQERRTLGYVPTKSQRIATKMESIESSFTPDSVNSFYLERLLKLTERYGVRVYYSHGPLFDEHARQMKVSNYFHELNQYLAKYSERFAHFEMLDDEIPAFQRSELGDGVTHLNKVGAKRFTLEMAERVNRAQKRKKSQE
ncbi:MAG: hypothetical protein VYC39_13015 [Myxococcota bacterium]|nr:hypothetical protein [Myxococcota bacterium]